MRSFLPVLLLACLTPMTAWTDSQVLVIPSESGTAYQEAINAFQEGMAGRQVNIRVPASITPDIIQQMTGEANLIVPIGLRAARLVAEHDAGKASILALMVPKSAAEHLPWPVQHDRRRISAVYVDQPVGRSFDLVRVALPGRLRVGAMCSRENTALSKALELEATRQGLHLEVAMVDTSAEVGPALRRLLPDVEALLLVPDPVTLNSSNLQNVLLAAYRQRIPVIGFSPGQVNAGATASVYATPAQIGRQGAQMAARWTPASGDLPPAQSPSAFEISVNQQVVRSLDLAMPVEAEIRHRMEERRD